jgi:hypothetical protein
VGIGFEQEQEQERVALTPPRLTGTIGPEERPMGHPYYTKEEIAARGQAIYEQRIRPQVEPAQNGKYLVINVETAEYEIDADEATVSERAYARYPGAPLYGMRIGCPAWGHIKLVGAATPR